MKASLILLCILSQGCKDIVRPDVVCDEIITQEMYLVFGGPYCDDLRFVDE